jgi:hypothetical protein
MQVEMSLAELLINAITHGRVPGVQFKRGWSDEKATFEGLNVVIGTRLDGARRVAVESELRRLRDEHPYFQTRRANLALEAALAEIVGAADRLLQGGDAGPLRDALHNARGLVSTWPSTGVEEGGP